VTIRRQVLLALVPVFAALALVGNLVTYVLHRQALLQGLQTQAGAFAVGIASMPTNDEIDALLAGRAAETTLPAAVARLIRQDPLTRVTVWDPRGERVLFKSAPDADLLPPQSINHAGAEPYQVAPLPDAAGEARLVAYAPVSTQGDETRAIVGAEIDATLFPQEMGALRRRLWRTGLLIVGVGVLIALAVSSVIARELRRLTRAAEQIEHGRYTAPRAGLIAEVSELAQTFGVLEDVIGELRTKSQRAFAENEQFRSEDDLLNLYRDELLPPRQERRAGITAAVSVTPDAAGVFRECVQSTTADVHLCFGRVIGRPSIHTATLASAAGRELADRLARGESAAAALSATARLFPLEVATVLSWTCDTPRVSRIDWSPTEIRNSEHPLDAAGAPQVHHHLPTAAAAAVDVYLRRFPTHSPDTCARDLVALAGAGNSAIVVLSK